jgi:hypothetical protein
MSASEFRQKHPKIFHQIVDRGSHAMICKMWYDSATRKHGYQGPFKYGKPKLAKLIERELPLLA